MVKVYLERKFYTGNFDLPSEKINKLFKEGYINRLGKKDTYGDVNIGLAPGGIVVVWLLGSGKTTEIGRYKASETEVSIKEFSPYAELSMEEFINSVLEEDFNEEIKANMNPDSIPFGKWDAYRKKFEWKPSIIFEKEGKLEEIRMTFYNGESLYTIGSNDILNQFEKYAIPDHIRMEWSDQSNNQFGTRIYFEENEIQTVFEKIFKQPKEEPTELMLLIRA